MSPQEMLHPGGGLALLIGIPALLACILRLGRSPGGPCAAAVLGGILGGILLGPAGLGSAAPHWHERLMRGGAPQRAALDAETDRSEQALRTLRATGVTPAALIEFESAREAALGPLREAHARAVGAHRAVLGSGFIALAAAGALGTGFVGARAPGRGGGRETWARAAGAGLLAAAFAALPTAVLLRWALSMDVRSALVIGAAVAGGSVLAAAGVRARPAAGRAPIVTYTGLASFFLSAAIIGALMGGLSASAVAAMAAGGVAGFALGRDARPDRRVRRLVRVGVLGACLPALTAFAAASFDPRAISGAWVGALVLLFGAASAGDGHLLGAFLGFGWLGRDADRARAGRLAVETGMGGLGAGQAGLGAVIALGAAPLSPAWATGMGLILVNAATVELTAGLSRRLLRLRRR
jgi:hypothetical protein